MIRQAQYDLGFVKTRSRLCLVENSDALPEWLRMVWRVAFLALRRYTLTWDAVPSDWGFHTGWTRCGRSLNAADSLVSSRIRGQELGIKATRMSLSWGAR